MPTSLPSRPADATLTVAKAARLLGVHANTVRAWSAQGRLRHYRINERGDRRYRLSDLQRFLAAAQTGTDDGERPIRATRRGNGAGPAAASDGARFTHGRHLEVMRRIAQLSASVDPLEAVLAEAADVLRDALDAAAVGVWERTPATLVARAMSGPLALPSMDLPPGYGVIGRALEAGAPVKAVGHDHGPLPVASLGGVELAMPIPGVDGPWGALLVAARPGRPIAPPESDLAEAAAASLGAIVTVQRRGRDMADRLHRAEALGRVAGDIGSRLDLHEVLADLADHALVLFTADRALVTVRDADGRATAEVSRGLSPGYLAAVRVLPERSLPALAAAERRPLVAARYADDPRGTGVRAAVVQEGFDTLASAPLVAGDEVLGTVEIVHDTQRTWTAEELALLAELAGHAGVAIRTARHYNRMASWTAQLQSIQQLGARLSRLTSVAEIGHAIATELRQLIDYHNVRVYRIDGHDLVPVAMLGQVGEYVDETPDQLRIAVGQGITGWVAEHRVAENLPDAARDPRAMTIPGTEDDLDESMLLAPMLHEDQCLGVLVLSKLGTHQFTDDDLRLLVIYASFAAQAMANADATERLREQSAMLERRLRAQRELLRITESILTTLDTAEVLERITERLGSLIRCDNLAIEVVDRTTGLLVPLTARGLHADEYMQPWEPGETGIATWVVDHNEPVLVADERNDPRVNHFRSMAPVDGSLIVVPLLGPEGAIGVLTLERLGVEERFGDDEFELVKLFAAQVSIALKNAEIHRAVEIRARTDDLTRLLNHGSFQEWLGRSIALGDPFSLVMIDLDRFKSVNDALGHQAGDSLLREIADAIVGAARETDHVFRYGGDEFVVLLPGTDGAHAVRVAERIRAAVTHAGGPGSRWHLGGLEVSASVGVATFPADGRSADEVLLAADRACFVAKRTRSGLVATAADGLALASEFTLSAPTPVDPPTMTLA